LRIYFITKKFQNKKIVLVPAEADCKKKQSSKK
jgi:hypothetical protein